MTTLEIVVLRDKASERLFEDPYRLASFYGASEFLKMYGVEFSSLDVSSLTKAPEMLDKYCLCIAPDLEFIHPDTVEILKRWTEAGGILIATGFFARKTPQRPIEISTPPLSEYGEDLFGISEATITGNPEPDIGAYMNLFPAHKFFRDVRSLLPVLGVNPVLRGGEKSEKVGFLLDRDERWAGDLVIVNRYGDGVAVRLSARVFRTIGLLLSSCQWKELLWPGLKKAVNRIYLSLDRDGWSSIPVVDQMCKFVYNVMDVLVCEKNGVGLIRKWFWPHQKDKPTKIVASVVHDVDSPNLEWIRMTHKFDKELGVPSTFYFLSHAERREYPPVYEPIIFDENFIREVKNLVDAGCEVTVHGQVTEKDDVLEERDNFIKAIGIKPTGVRMHYVLHSAERVRNYQEAGYEYDLSFYDNYHKGPGFLTFSTYPFHPLDPEKAEVMDIIVGGPVLEDGILCAEVLPRPWCYHGSWGKEALARGKFFIDMIESENGFLAMNWHTHNINATDPIRRCNRPRILKELIEYIRQKPGCLFMLPVNIFRWWRIRENVRVHLSYDGVGGVSVTVQNMTKQVVEGFTLHTRHPVNVSPCSKELKVVSDEDGSFILLPSLNPKEKIIFKLQVKESSHRD